MGKDIQCEGIQDSLSSSNLDEQCYLDEQCNMDEQYNAPQRRNVGKQYNLEDFNESFAESVKSEPDTPQDAECDELILNNPGVNQIPDSQIPRVALSTLNGFKVEDVAPQK